MRKRELQAHIQATTRLAERMQLNAQVDFVRVLDKIRSMYDELITTVSLEAGKDELRRRKK